MKTVILIGGTPAEREEFKRENEVNTFSLSEFTRPEMLQYLIFFRDFENGYDVTVQVLGQLSEFERHLAQIAEDLELTVIYPVDVLHL